MQYHGLANQWMQYQKDLHCRKGLAFWTCTLKLKCNTKDLQIDGCNTKRTCIGKKDLHFGLAFFQNGYIKSAIKNGIC